MIKENMKKITRRIKLILLLKFKKNKYTNNKYIY